MCGVYVMEWVYDTCDDIIYMYEADITAISLCVRGRRAHSFNVFLLLIVVNTFNAVVV